MRSALALSPTPLACEAAVSASLRLRAELRLIAKKPDSSTHGKLAFRTIAHECRTGIAGNRWKKVKDAVAENTKLTDAALTAST